MFAEREIRKKLMKEWEDMRVLVVVVAILEVAVVLVVVVVKGYCSTGVRVMVVVVVVLVLATVGVEPAVEDCGYEGAAGKELFGMWA